MTYTCKDCDFVFFRVSDVKQCPACGSPHIRAASQEEHNTLQSCLKNLYSPTQSNTTNK